MKKKTQIYRVFDTPPPHSYGLRGHPYLWHEMRGFFFNMPDLEIEKPRELKQLLVSVFEEMTGKTLDGDDFQIERLMHGGMSSV